MSDQARIMVTGGAGFIGQNFVHHIAGLGRFDKIVVVDALTYAANPTSIEPLIRSGLVVLKRGDITDATFLSRCFDEHGFDNVIHFAAESHVDRSISGPDAFIQTNIMGTYNLLKCALGDWQKRQMLDRARFLHVSTDEVFGDLTLEEPPFSETSPYKPSSPYSASKASSDHLVRAFHRTYRLPILVTNCSNNYGPFQYPEKLIPLMIINALLGRKLPVYGDGLNIRDWLFVGDHCSALSLVLEKGALGRTYNVGGNAERPNKTIVERICDIVDTAFAGSPALAKQYPSSPTATGRSCRSLITYVQDRPGHDRRYAIDSSRIRRELGWAPAETFDTGLARTVMWYIANEPWWRQAMTSGFHEWVAENYGARGALAQRLSSSQAQDSAESQG